MRKVTLAKAMEYFEANDVLPESIVSHGRYLLFKRWNVEEWVYVEVAA